MGRGGPSEELRIVELPGFWKSIAKRRVSDVEMLYFDLGSGFYRPMDQPMGKLGLKKLRYGTGSQHSKGNDGYTIILADYLEYNLIVLFWAFPASEVKDFDDLDPKFAREIKKAKLRIDVLVETGRL